MKPLLCPECGEPLEEEDGMYYINQEEEVETVALCRSGCSTKFKVIFKRCEASIKEKVGARAREGGHEK